MPRLSSKATPTCWSACSPRMRPGPCRHIAPGSEAVRQSGSSWSGTRSHGAGSTGPPGRTDSLPYPATSTTRPKTHTSPAVIDVLTLRGEQIAAVTAFLTAQVLEPPYSAAWVAGEQMFALSNCPPTCREAIRRPVSMHMSDAAQRGRRLHADPGARRGRRSTPCRSGPSPSVTAPNRSQARRIPLRPQLVPHFRTHRVSRCRNG